MRTLYIMSCILSLVSIASAGVIGTTGQVTIIAPPPDVTVNGPVESNTTGFFFTERTGLALPSTLTVDFTSTGSHTANPVAPLPTISAGTLVDSYYFVTDPIGSDVNNLRNFDGSFTFSTDILGVIALDPEFASSNAALGHPGTSYSASGVAYEMGNPRDSFIISADRRTLTFSSSANTAADDLRIITSAVPEPGSAVLIVAGLLGLAFRFKHVSQRQHR
jgi:hypothetical protein